MLLFWWSNFRLFWCEAIMDVFVLLNQVHTAWLYKTSNEVYASSSSSLYCKHTLHDKGPIGHTQVYKLVYQGNLYCHWFFFKSVICWGNACVWFVVSFVEFFWYGCDSHIYVHSFLEQKHTASWSAIMLKHGTLTAENVSLPSSAMYHVIWWKFTILKEHVCSTFNVQEHVHIERIAPCYFFAWSAYISTVKFEVAAYSETYLNFQ
jgi:hypothetical protein